MDAVVPVKMARWEPSQLDGKTVAFRFTRGSAVTARQLQFGMLSASGTKEQAVVMISPDSGEDEPPNYFLTLRQEVVDQIEAAPLRLGCACDCMF